MTNQVVTSPWLGSKFGTPVAEIASIHGTTMVLICQVQSEEFRSAMDGILVGHVIDAEWVGRQAGEKIRVTRTPYQIEGSKFCFSVIVEGGYSDAPLIRIGIKNNRI